MLVGLICPGKAPCRYTPGAARTRPDVFYLCYEMRMFGAFHHNLLFFWPYDVLVFQPGLERCSQETREVHPFSHHLCPIQASIPLCGYSRILSLALELCFLFLRLQQLESGKQAHLCITALCCWAWTLR